MSYIEAFSIIQDHSPEAEAIENMMKNRVALFVIQVYHKLKKYGENIPIRILDIVFEIDKLGFTLEQKEYFYLKISDLIRTLHLIDNSIYKIIVYAMRGHKEKLFELFERMTANRYTTIGSEARHLFCDNYGWNIPCRESFEIINKNISKDLQILEVGADLGLTSAILKMYGFNIIVTDNYDWCSDIDKHFSNIENISSINAIVKYPEVDVLLMAWSNYHESFAYDSLVAFKGTYLIFFGEYGEYEEYGDCYSNKFYNLLNEEWYRLVENTIHNWNFVNSRMIIFKRKIVLIEDKVKIDYILSEKENSSLVTINTQSSSFVETSQNVINQIEKRFYNYDELSSLSDEYLNFIQSKLEKEVQLIYNGKKKINIYNWICEYANNSNDNELIIYKILFNNKRIKFSEKLELLAYNNNISCTIFYWKKIVFHSIYEKLKLK